MGTPVAIGRFPALVLWGAVLFACSSPVRADPGIDGISIVINEVLASNSSNVADPQGQYDDWVELYNRSDTPVDVGGMFLTDDLEDPTRWQLPAVEPSVTTIPPGGYLVVWADADTEDAGLHADFRLSAAGGTVALLGRDGGTVVDSVSFGPQMADVSYGRVPDGDTALTHMAFPSQGGSNFRVFQGFPEPPEFTPHHGFYEDEVLVTITCPTEGAMIYYTTDGSEPYPIDQMRPGSRARLYSEPLRIAETTCLRAAAVKGGWRTSPPETRTYIFIEDVITQSPQGQRPDSSWPSGSVKGQMIDYGMDPEVVNDPAYRDVIDDALLAVPSISLVTDLVNLFDPQEGIYVNARAQGLGWERPVSAELLQPDGAAGFQIDAGLRIRGGYSRSGGNPKHAFRLFFRSLYGEPRLRYPLFGDEGAEEFENIDLRTSQNYSWSFEGHRGNSHDTFVREVFSRDTQRDMGRPHTRSRYYHLYINGHYWGLYQSQERSEASYAETYFGGDKEDYDVVKSRAGNGGYDIEATDGNLDAWRTLWEATIGGFDDETYYRVQGLNPDGTRNPQYPKLLDVDNLLDYMLCTYYVGDPDGPVSAWARVANNFYAIYNREDPDGFKFFRHDGEHSLDNLHESRLFAPTTTAVGSRFNQSNPLWLHTHLIEHPEYRMRFADRVYRHFFHDGVLTPDACIDRFMARAEQIETAIVAESARWGDAKRSRPRTRDDDWLPDIEGMITNYFPRRTGIVLEQFRSHGWYPSVAPPTLSRRGGHVSRGSTLTMASAGMVYYTLDGTDPRLPERAGQIVATHTLVPEGAAKRVLVPTAAVAGGDAWRSGEPFDDSGWALTGGSPGGIGYERSSGYQSLIGLDVGNLMYNRSTSCYVRIPFEMTLDPADLDVLTLKVRYDDGFVAYLNGVEIKRTLFNGTPAWDSAAAGNHEADSTESFPISEHLDLLRPGGNLLAIHALNVSTSSSDFLVSVSLEAAESTIPRQAGVSPAAIRYDGPVSLDRSTRVKARTLSGSTWSALSEAVFAVGPAAESLRISEMMYHPADIDDPNSEFIELTNVGAESIDLHLVRFTDGVDYTFEPFELAPGGYCLLVCDPEAFEARYGPGLPVVGQYGGRLDNAGEGIELVDAVGQVIQSFEFEDDWYTLTDGLGFSLVVADPDGSDSLNEKTAWRTSDEPGGSPGQ